MADDISDLIARNRSRDHTPDLERIADAQRLALEVLRQQGEIHLLNWENGALRAQLDEALEELRMYRRSPDSLRGFAVPALPPGGEDGAAPDG